MNTLHLEIPDHRRLSLDVNRSRVLARYVRIDGPTGSVTAEAVDLDTGGAQALIAPLAAVEPLLLDRDTRPDHVQTAGGRVDTTVVDVTLRLGNWVFDGVELHASPRFGRWLIGMPVLRHFDLLLRDQHVGGPYLHGPDPGLVRV